MGMSIMEDAHEISCILVGNGTTSDLYCVGQRHGITKIVCYREYGEMSLVPWFAMYHEDNIIKRINGKFAIEVMYNHKEQV